MGGRNPQALNNWLRSKKNSGKPADAAATLDRLNTFPRLTKTFPHLGDLWFAQNNTKGAIREYGAVVALHPLDQASAIHLARAYLARARRIWLRSTCSRHSKPHQLSTRSEIAAATEGFQRREMNKWPPSYARSGFCELKKRIERFQSVRDNILARSAR